jgi:mono/diheme cytochrome c family protein
MGRIMLRILLAVLGVAVLAFGVVYVLGGRAIRRAPALPPETFVVGTADSTVLAEGARLATVYQCTECHGEGLNGTDFLKGMPFMNLPAPNLTPGRAGGPLSDEQWERAVRHGVGPDGRPLLIMPSEAFTGLADADLAAIVSYARSLPASDPPLMSRSVGPAGRAAALFAGASVMPSRTIDHRARHPASVVADGSAGHGEYLARACRACHGPDYGGMILTFADDLKAPDLTPRNPTGLSSWSEADFLRAMKEGVRPDGRTLSVVMPWRAFGQYSPEELAALWRYLRSLPAATSAGSG